MGRYMIGFVAFFPALAAFPLLLAASPPPPPKQESRVFDLKALDFSAGNVMRKFHSFDAVARKLAQPEWLVLPYRNLAYRGGSARYVAGWCRLPGPRGGFPLEALDGKPNHRIELAGFARSSGDPRIAGLSLFATFIPKRKGWGACLSYRTYDGAAPLGEHFRIFLFHPDHDIRQKGGQGKWALDLVDGHFSAFRKQSHFQYQLQVSRYGKPASWMGDTRTPRDGEVRDYLTSAAGFRAAALKEFDDLEIRVRRDIPAGLAIFNVLDFKGVRSENPPREVLPAFAEELSKANLEDVLREAMREIDRRRRLVNDHYEAMFEAARTAFPIVECLGKN